MVKVHPFKVALLGLVASLLLATPGTAAVGADSSSLQAAVTTDGVRQHQGEFQAIADSNGGTRAAGTPGHVASAEYVIQALESAGYSPVKQHFEFPVFSETAPPVLERVSPDPATYSEGADFFTMSYSGSGDTTAALQATNDISISPSSPNNTSNSGCESADFAQFDPGSIALIQRGTCTFQAKALNAIAAGASGVIIFNEGQPGRTDVINGTLGDSSGQVVPVVGASFAVGQGLYDLLQSSEVEVHLATTTFTEIRDTFNVLADTGGRADRTVVVGAHLDSVSEGPGINDNGSGSAAILEIALQLKELGIEPRNRVRFAWWSAEENGLLGSEYYVKELSKREIKDTMANLNFDMVGSPNFVRFVYDGDGSATPDAGPKGSKNIEQIFLDHFASNGLATSPTAFDGRSDYGPFIAAGIPAGGLFTGAEGIKSTAEAEVYGGTAGEAYDPCYHQACDDFANNSDTALDQMSDAAAHATLQLAMTTSAINGTDKASPQAVQRSNAMEHKASLLRK